MKTGKRLLALMLALTMAASFAGCEEKEDAEDEDREIKSSFDEENGGSSSVESNIAAKKVFEAVEEYCQQCIDEGIVIPDGIFEGTNDETDTYYGFVGAYGETYVGETYVTVITKQWLEDEFSNYIDSLTEEELEEIDIDDERQEWLSAMAEEQFYYLMCGLYEYFPQDDEQYGEWYIRLNDKGLPEWVIMINSSHESSYYPQGADGVDEFITERKITGANSMAKTVYTSIQGYCQKCVNMGRPIPEGEYEGVVTLTENSPSPRDLELDGSNVQSVLEQVVGSALGKSAEGSLWKVRINSEGFPEEAAWAPSASSEYVGCYPTASEEVTPDGFNNFEIP